ncbi:MAG: SP_1767 family glycosyltransferase [Marinifilaceae bacterium]
MTKIKLLYKFELGLRKIRYQSTYKKLIAGIKSQINILDSNTTLDYIIANKCSVSRYGDGEFDVMRGTGNGFCSANHFLQNKLEEVMNNEIPNHIVCIPFPFTNQDNLTLRAHVYWIAYFCKHHKQLLPILSNPRQFYDAEFTRFYLSYKDKSVADQYIEKNKRIWHNRELLIIEGEFSRLGVGNDLFANAKDIKRILCPTVNAFTKYDEILEKARNYGKDKLILLALGQTATALAYDLAKEGYWAIDIGHIDLEYEWYIMQANDKVTIYNKHVNEAKAYIPYEVEFYDESYDKQILETLA